MTAAPRQLATPSAAADLEAQLQPARAAARAGDAATASLSSQVTRVNTALTNLGPLLTRASAMVVAEEMVPLLDEMRAAVVEIEGIKSKINAGRNYLLGAPTAMEGRLDPRSRRVEKGRSHRRSAARQSLNGWVLKGARRP
jgi:hypothetical protein